MTKYINFIENFQCKNLEQVEKWINSNLNNYLAKNIENQDEIEHILDYLCSNIAPKRLNKMSYDEAKINSIKWLKSLIKTTRHIVENESDVEIVLELSDGFKWVQLISEQSYKNEGVRMKHCVGSYFNKDVKIYSLRDKNNNPHCTIQENSQIKGKGNGSISPKYIEYVVKFLEYLGMNVSDNEMKNLGYFNYSKFEQELHEDSLKLKYKNYLPISSTLKDKDGDNFFDLDFINILELIDNSGKICVDLKLLDYGINRLILKKENVNSGNNFKNVSSGYNSKNASSGSYSQNVSSGDYSQNVSSGYNSKNASSGSYSQNVSSGDYSQNASSGDYSKNASSGNNSKNVSSGYNSKNASSGSYSKNVSSGNYSQNASIGYNSKNASSGNYSKNVSSGNYSKNVSSGDYSKNASSGDYSQNASIGNNSEWIITGEKNIVASIGYKDKVKGVIGTWVTLAQYIKIDNLYEVDLVLSKKIDGIILKENVFYTLIDGKFTETE